MVTHYPWDGLYFVSKTCLRYLFLIQRGISEFIHALQSGFVVADRLEMSSRTRENERGFEIAA